MKTLFLWVSVLLLAQSALRIQYIPSDYFILWIALAYLFIEAARSLLLPRLEATVRADSSNLKGPLSLENHMVM